MWQMPVGAVEMIGQVGAAFAAFLPVRTEHEMINNQLTASVEEISQRFFPLRSIKDVILVDLDHWQLATSCTERVSLTIEFFFARQQISPRHQPFIFRYDFSIHFHFRQFHFVFPSFDFLCSSRGIAALGVGPGGAELHQAGSIFIRRVWFVVPDPPLVRRSLGVALRRVLPLLLAPERSDVEVVPSVPHLFIATIVDEVGAEHAVAIADERVRAVPLVHTEVFVEVIRYGVPRHLPAHLRLHARDVLLRRARGERERGIANVQMGDVRDLVGHHGATNTGMLGPTFYAGFEEGSVNDQLTPTLEQVEQAHFALESVELEILLHAHPRHHSTPRRTSATVSGPSFMLDLNYET